MQDYKSKNELFEYIRDHKDEINEVGIYTFPLKFASDFNIIDVFEGFQRPLNTPKRT